ncbi:SLOG family protein [Flavonifractor sp. An100]|uniref:SLOG family protein n=1 Tax=Flavonifractor sp. An100 TaxID=1965538 RepID=UPI000B38772C|nr:SLOG family protein [Flavonifractor sp. An100]OUQ78182.1 hypothetical protein B5E43_09000 [Flavonifractor sp. An100]
MERETTCCFTGHRPDKLPWGEQEEDPRCLALKRKLADALERAFQDGYRHFISGMARGADLYFAEAVLKLRESYPEITLEGARPYEGQASGWPAAEQQRYWKILDQCNYETLVQHRYNRGCMMRRNRYMVDRSKRIIVVYDGGPGGGTAQTLSYAMKQGLEQEILPVE